MQSSSCSIRGHVNQDFKVVPAIASPDVSQCIEGIKPNSCRAGNLPPNIAHVQDTASFYILNIYKFVEVYSYLKVLSSKIDPSYQVSALRHTFPFLMYSVYKTKYRNRENNRPPDFEGSARSQTPLNKEKLFLECCLPVCMRAQLASA
jgi:hypothetical protein